MSTTLHTSSIAGRYLTMVIGGEGYGIAVLKVREIIRLLKITPVPHLPAAVKGVINLRGRVIPVVDLRITFGLEAKTDERTCVVVVQVQGSMGNGISLGLVVDRVEEVLNLTAEHIAPTPEFGANIDTAFILGMAKVKGDVQTLLDIDRVISSCATLDSAVTSLIPAAA